MGTEQSALNLSDITSAWDPRPTGARIEDPADSELLPIQRYHRRSMTALGAIALIAVASTGLIYFAALRPTADDLERKNIELSVLKEKLFESTQRLTLAEARLSVLDTRLEQSTKEREQAVDDAIQADRSSLLSRLEEAQNKGEIKVRTNASGDAMLEIEQKRRRRRSVKTTIPLFDIGQTTASKR